MMFRASSFSRRLSLAGLVLLVGLPATGLGPGLAAQDQDLLKTADEVLADVVRLRGLEAKGPVQKGLKTREEIRSYVIDQIDTEFPRDEIELQQKAYARMGLFDQDIDLRKIVVDLLTDQIAGFYDPESSTLFIADWIPDNLQKPVMAHELLHALQDQHFDLDRFLKSVADDEDQLLARKSLVEGEGVAVMMDFLLEPTGTNFQSLPNVARLIEQGQSAQSSEAFDAAPGFLKDALLFQYSYGAQFVQRVLKSGGWKDVSAIYSDPPTSSEQILHPSKYLRDRDNPVPVELSRRPDEIPDDWTASWGNVLGEFTVYQLLKPYVKMKEARKGAEGWGGDRFQLYQGPEGRLALWMRIVWDTEEDAREFFDIYRRAVKQRHSLEDDALGAVDAQSVAIALPGREIRVTLAARQVEVLDRDLDGSPEGR